MTERYNTNGLIPSHPHVYRIIEQDTMTYPKGSIVCSICGIPQDKPKVEE